MDEWTDGNLHAQLAHAKASAIKMAKLFGNSGNPDQMPHSVASDLGLHCLQITLFGVSRLQWVKGKEYTINRGTSVKII